MIALKPYHSTSLQNSTAPTNWGAYGVLLNTDFKFNHTLQPGQETDGQTLRFDCCNKLPVTIDYDNSIPVYRSPGKMKAGLHNAYLYREQGVEIYRFPEVGEFLINEQQIVCKPKKNGSLNMVEIYLLGLVFSYWFEKRNILGLHASGVSVDNQAVLFLAAQKSGKSTLSAAFLQAGHPLLGDNLAALEPITGTYFLRPAFPCMRMWPDTAQYFLGHYEDFDLFRPQVSKRLIPVGGNGFGAFEPIARPIRCIYIPQRKEATRNHEVIITRLEPREAIFELLKHSFISNMVSGLRWQQQRIRAFTRLLQKAKVSRVEYPEGYQHLPRVRDVLLDDIRNS